MTNTRIKLLVMKKLACLMTINDRIYWRYALILTVLLIGSVSTPGVSQSLIIGVQPTAAVGNGPSGVGLINSISYQKSESRWSYSVGIGMHTLYSSQLQLPNALYDYSTNITFNEVDEAGELGGEIDEGTFLQGKEKGIRHFTPKKDFRNDLYLFSMIKWDVVRSSKSVVSIGFGLGLGITNSSELLGGYTDYSPFSEREHLVYYEFSQRLKYIHWGLMNRIEYSYRLKERIFLNAVLGYYYIPLKRDFFVSDERILYLSLGCSFELN